MVLQELWGVRVVCVDPRETPGIPAIWQGAYSSGEGLHGLTVLFVFVFVCLCVCVCVCVCPEADRLIGHMAKPSQVAH